jgi:tRNA (cmo5U34)-methyltransferase
MNGFDILAPVYDKLARFFFGPAIERAQFHFLDHVSSAQEVLIIGGGTGDLAKVLLDRFAHVRVNYVETSAAMIARAAEKCHAHRDRIHFIQDSINTLSPDARFDVVITPFFLDMFPNEDVDKLVESIAGRLNLNGKWIATDFTKSPKLLHKLALWSMYRFFRMLCNIQARSLPAWEKALENRLNLLESKDFYSGFIRSCVYVIAR